MLGFDQLLTAILLNTYMNAFGAIPFELASHGYHLQNICVIVFCSPRVT